MDAEATANRGRWALGLTAAAFAWSLALVAGAFLLPLYSTAGGGSGHSGTPSTSTLVGENGLGVLVPVALPAGLVALVWFALHSRCSQGSLGSAYFAWALVALLAGFCVATGFSNGLLAFPVVLLLAGAARLTPSPD